MMKVGKRLAEGADNSVYDVPKGLVAGVPTPMLLRSSIRPEESRQVLREERSLARIAEEEKIHPVIYALGITQAPFGCPGYRNLYLMSAETTLHSLLYSEKKKDQKYAQFLANPSVRKRAVESILGCLLRAADLGLCLLDVKPGNVVCSVTTGTSYLIDFDPQWAWWMPEEVLEVFEQRPQEEYLGGYEQGYRGAYRRGGGPCAKSRGVYLYLMVLLLYAHLQKDFRFDAGTFAVQLSEALLGILRTSCVPLETLLAYAKAHVRDQDAEWTFFHALGKVVHSYFRKDLTDLVDLMKWIFLDYPYKEKLLTPFCSGKSPDVSIRGLAIVDDAASVGGGPRETGIAMMTDEDGSSVHYPCAPLVASRKYVIDRGFPFRRLLRATMSSSFPFTQKLSVTKTALTTPLLEVQ